MIVLEATDEDFGQLMAVDARNVLHLDHRYAAEVEGPNHRGRAGVAHTSDRIGDKRFVGFRRLGVAARRRPGPVGVAEGPVARPCAIAPFTGLNEANAPPPPPKSGRLGVAARKLQPPIMFKRNRESKGQK